MRTGVFWSHTFFPNLIKPNGVIFDFGVNYGGFSSAVASLCTRVIGFEANPYWTETTRVPLPPSVTVIPKAVAAKAGRYPLYLETEGGPNCSLYTDKARGNETVRVEAVELREALALATSERIELIKIDIEGEELPLLSSAQADLLQRAAQITVEFEEMHGKSAIRSVIHRMEALGFWTVKFSWRNYGDVLFVNQNLEPLSVFQRAQIILVHKYARGIVRILRRHIS